MRALCDMPSPLVKTHRWVRDGDGGARLLVKLTINEQDLEVRFPSHYPDGCPSVRPVPYEAPFSSHQFMSSGVLCLELGPDNWNSVFTAADMVMSAAKLIVLESTRTATTPPIPSRHASNIAERIRLGSGALIRSPVFDEWLRSAATPSEFEFAWLTRGGTRVFPVSLPKGAKAPDALPAVRDELHWTGVFVRLDEGAPTSNPATSDELVALIRDHGHFELGADHHCIVAHWPSGHTQGYLRAIESVIALEDMPMPSESAGRTSARISALVSRVSVGIVGLGSLGSKVAASLARTGVANFTLVDGDVFQGPNVCRHTGTYADVGSMKVNSVAAHLRDVARTPLSIVTRAVDLGSATNPELHASVLDALSKCDVLVDATADGSAFSLVTMVASDYKRIMVWGEVFGGGLGGMVASAHPNFGPCPRCVRSAFFEMASTWPPAPRAGEGAYGGEAGDPIAATDAAVSTIAGILTLRILDLVADEAAQATAICLLGFRRGWVFEGPWTSITLPVRTDDWSCTRCWRQASDPDPATLARAESLFA